MWQQALKETVHEYRGRPIAWGESDCCQFARAYFRRATGRDVGGDVEYDSEGQAKRIMAGHGGLSGLFRHFLGEPHEAQPGDVCLVSLSNEGDLTAAGVYAGYAVFTIHPEMGLCRVPADRVREAWPVE